MRDAEGYMEFLQSLTTLGAGFKSLLGDCLSSTSIYAESCRPVHCKTKEYVDFVASSQKTFAESVGTILTPIFPRPLSLEYPSLASEGGPFNHDSILDELMFWIVKYEFPQSLVTFLLTMLPDEAYKNAFTNSFIKHYSRMTFGLQESTQPQVSEGLKAKGRD